MTQWGLDALFNPAKRHMDEEKRRLQATREQIGDSSGGERIDFESGKVTIRRSSKPKAEADGPDSADTEDDEIEELDDEPVAEAAEGTDTAEIKDIAEAD